MNTVELQQPVTAALRGGRSITTKTLNVSYNVDPYRKMVIAVISMMNPIVLWGPKQYQQRATASEEQLNDRLIELLGENPQETVNRICNPAYKWFEVIPNGPRTITKLTLMRRLDALGKWTTFKTVIGQMPQIVQDAFDLCNELSEDDPLLVQNRPAFIQALGITGDQMDSLFD